MERSDTTFFTDLKQVYLASMLPLHLFKDNQLIVSYSSYAEDDIDWDSMLSYAISVSSVRETRCAVWNDQSYSKIYCGILFLGDGYLCMVGPCSSEKLPYSYTRSFTRRYHLPHVYLPLFSVRRLEAVLELLIALFPDPAERKKPISIDRFITERNQKEPTVSTDYAVQEYGFNRSDHGFSHYSYRFELMLKQYLQSANTDALLKLVHDAPRETAGTMSQSPEQQAEYSAVIFVSTMARYAIEAGVEQYLAFNLSDLFIQHISAVKSIEAYSGIMDDAIRRFTREVDHCKNQDSGFPYITRCKDYISANLNKRFSIRQLAEELRITPEYLSQLFTKTQGISLKAYITKKRVEAAGNMLTFSDKTISEIAAYYCFSSQSHFGEVFKRIMGVSPSAYRNQSRKYG